MQYVSCFLEENFCDTSNTGLYALSYTQLYTFYGRQGNICKVFNGRITKINTFFN